jgi:hypothetical protein
MTEVMTACFWGQITKKNPVQVISMNVFAKKKCQSHQILGKKI